jgi:ubiquinone/menaquinone biosynthesis C-methylase UbiE
MIKQKLFENFAHPRGLWGRLGQVMAHKSANIERGKWALAELDPQPHDRLLELELGYGPGLSLSEACRRVTRGHVTGVDVSPVMLRQATRGQLTSVSRAARASR